MDINKQIQTPANALDLTLMLKNAYDDIQENVLINGKLLSELPNVVALADTFKMNLNQAAVFCAIYSLTEREIEATEIGLQSALRPFIWKNSKKLRQDLRELKRMGYIRSFRNYGNIHYVIDNEINRALDENDLHAIMNTGPVGIDRALEYFNDRLLNFGSPSQSEIANYLGDIQKANPNLNLVTYCEENDLFDFQLDAFLLFAICTKTVIDSDPFDFKYLDLFISSNRRCLEMLRYNIVQEVWAPIKHGFVEFAGGSVVDSNPELKLTQKGYDFFFSEFDTAYLNVIKQKMARALTPMIQPEAIEEVPLFFNPDFQERIGRLQSILMPDTFQNYQNSFAKSARMKGMTVLFYGGPGCGKTEFVMQLSKQTGRPLMKVDITDFQSKWVGDSEKKLKSIFSQYRSACANATCKPILFLNECDQMIGKRVSINSSVDHMTNALQNILLEEMECFDGILIGTSNLTENMDAAFERRWLMKFKFDAPRPAALVSVWRSMLPELSVVEAQEIVQRFEFTPGEISNISKRYKIESILGLNTTPFKTIVSLCETEQYSNAHSMKSIGFNAEQFFSKDFLLNSN
jgi:hypothetical protein